MNLSLFMELWSFETMQCLNFKMQRQKRHDVINDVNVTFLVWEVARCMKNMLFLANKLFFIILTMCTMELVEKMTLIHLYTEVAWS